MNGEKKFGTSTTHTERGGEGREFSAANHSRTVKTSPKKKCPMKKKAGKGEKSILEKKKKEGRA